MSPGKLSKDKSKPDCFLKMVITSIISFCCMLYMLCNLAGYSLTLALNISITQTKNEVLTKAGSTKDVRHFEFQFVSSVSNFAITY